MLCQVTVERCGFHKKYVDVGEAVLLSLRKYLGPVWLMNIWFDLKKKLSERESVGVNNFTFFTFI